MLSNSISQIVNEIIESIKKGPPNLLDKNGLIYIAMPNFSRIGNRLKSILGRPIYSPIEDYLKQLSRNGNMIVGLHWREYTMRETLWMLKIMGFSIENSYYYSEYNTGFSRKITNLIPSFRQSLVVIGRKHSISEFDFWLTDANT